MAPQSVASRSFIISPYLIILGSLYQYYGTRTLSLPVLYLMLNSAKIKFTSNKVTIGHRPAIILKPKNRNIVPSYSSTVKIYDTRFEDRLFGDKEGLQTLHN